MSKILPFYLGRFSGFHRGHAANIVRALRKYGKLLIIIGSHEQARTPKNPWTSSEREAMILAWYENTFKQPASNLIIKFQHDIPYNNDLWANYISQTVDTAMENEGAEEAIMVGSDRDQSTWYFNLFPQYRKDLGIEDGTPAEYSATQLRQAYFDPLVSPVEYQVVVNRLAPISTKEFLHDWRQTQEFKDIQAEFIFYEKYHTQFEIRDKSKIARAVEVLSKINVTVDQQAMINYLIEQSNKVPFPVQFLTADAMVVQAGHVLLVQRKKYPGKGLWALPGGFVNPNETMKAAALRELTEETKIKLSPRQLEGSIVGHEYFDEPGRSLRGRTLTHLFLLKLAETGDFPKTKASDDAEAVRWVKLSDIRKMRDQFFDDHYSMIETMISRLKTERKV